jgi:hypothetical protein
MGINRFYTPALPVYTSQFVEDKTPWENIIGFEQDKLQRGEKALSYAAETDALTGSLTPGYRTQQVAPQVTDYYKQKMNKWMQDYGESSYSIPALRELTKINAEFRADPNVKLIQQDREASSIYEQMRHAPTYRPETDPNIDPETGQVRQLNPGENFTPYGTPVDFADLRQGIRERFATLKPETSSAKPELVSLPGANKGEIYDAMRERDISRINPDTMKKTKDSLVQAILTGDDSVLGSRYQKMIAGNKWSEDYVRQIVEEEAKPFAHESYQDRYQWAPGQTGAHTKTKPEDISGNWDFNTPATLIQPGWSPASQGEKPTGEIGKVDAAKIKMDINTVTKEMTPEYYAAVKDNPELMLTVPNKISVNGKDIDRQGKLLSGLTNAMDFYAGNSASNIYSKNLIKTRAYSDPAGTTKMFDDYFAQKEKDLTPLSKEYLALQDQKKFVKDQLDDAYKLMKIDNTPFKNEFDYDQAIYAAKASGVFGSKDFPFKNETELMSKDPEKLTATEKIALRANQVKFANDQQKTMGWGKQHNIPSDMALELSKAYGGLEVGSDGRISGTIKKSDAGTTWNFMGSRMMKYDKHGIIQEVTPDEKKEILKANTPFQINSMLDNRSSDIGSGMLPITIGKDNYFIEGPKQWVEAGRLDNNAYSYELPNRMGVGDVFTVNDASGIFKGSPIKVTDRWNSEHAKQTPYDVSMLVRDNPKTGNVELLVFNDHPMKKEDGELLKPRTGPDDLGKGYKAFIVGKSGQPVDEGMMDLAVSMAYYDKIHEKNPRIDLDKEKNTLIGMTRNYIQRLGASQ